MLAVLSEPGATEAHYFIALQWREDRVTAIRDFRYVPYIVQDRLLELAPPSLPSLSSQSDHRSPP